MKAVWTSAIAGVFLLSLSPADAQTLQDALVKTYQLNPTLRAERSQLRATDETVAQALSDWRPVVSVDSTAGWDVSDSTITSASQSSDVTYPITGSVSVVQNLYTGGRSQAGIDGAENDVKAGRAELGLVEQTVLLSAATAYADVVRDQAVLELNINNERVLQRQLEATQDRFGVGEVTRTDVSQAESRLSSARADRIEAEGNLTESRAVYENIVGEKPPLLKPADPLKEIPASLEEAIEAAKTNNFSVQQTRFIEESAKNSVDEIRGELLPTVTVTGEVQTNYETVNTLSENQGASITLGFSMPLYASGSVSSRVRAAKQVVSQRREEYSQAVRDAIEDATEAWQTLQTGQAQIEAFTSAVNASQIALEGVREEANVGSRTVLDVLDAEQELLDSRVGLVGAQRDTVVATFQLRQAVGELTAAKLGLPVDLYDVTKHYKDVRGKWWGLEAPDGR